MQIVIDIDEKNYMSCQTSGYAKKSIYVDLVYAIRKGTILPKGHGDLIDRDKLIEELMESDKTHAENSREETLLYRNRTIIREQSTIIEADKKSD